MELKLLDRLDRGNGRWIDVLEENEGITVYRACGHNGAICRYTYDLWQAEVYVQYY